MPANVLTQRNAPDRQGVNRQETQLHPDGVRFDRFGKQGTYPVNASVYAQPLFVSSVDCGPKGTRDLVIVVTMENSVYAFDANQTGPNAQIWPAASLAGLKLGHSVPSQLFQNYGDFYGKPIGILSTPVIELTTASPASGIVYLVSFQFDQTAFAANQNKATPDMFNHLLFALDLGTGQVLRQTIIQGQFSGTGYKNSRIPKNDSREQGQLTHPLLAGNDTTSMIIDFGGKPVTVIDASGLGGPDSVVHFNSIMQLQRPGLLLQGSNLFIAFGSRGDEDPYHGWLFVYDKDSFHQTGVTCTTPNGGRGGIWQAGQGLIQDSKSNIYTCTGNGDNDQIGSGPLLVGRNLGESFLGFRFDSTGLRLNGWFSMFKDFDQQPPPETRADTRDDDFGAGAPALLPDDRIVAGGKDGWFFLIDPDQLDKVSSKDTVPQAFKASFNTSRGSRFGNALGRETRHIHGSPVVWNTGTGKVFVYVWGENDVVRVYQYAPETGQDPASGRFLDQPQNFVFGTVPPQGVELARGNIYASNEVPDRHGMPGGFLSLSVNANDASSAILWAAYPPFKDANQNDVAGRLAAFDASNFDSNLAFKRLNLLWHSQQNPEDDFGNFAKFCVPTIANGRVYQATGSNQIAIYGPKQNATALRLGFDGEGQGFVLNGSARISSTGGVVLTEHAHKPIPNPADPPPTFLAGSFFTRKTFDIRKFTTSFTFQLTAADADGLAFVVQAEGPYAIGSSGSGVGYTIDPFAPFAPNMQSTILHSFAVKFSLRDGQGAPVSHLALLVNGVQVQGFQDVDLLQQNPGSIDLRSGNRITANLRYDGNILFLNLRDEQTNVSTIDFRLLPGNIAQQINSVQGKAFVGFTGGTGGLSARQEIVAWTFQDFSQIAGA
jgi:hypothetical protein